MSICHHRARPMAVADTIGDMSDERAGRLARAVRTHRAALGLTQKEAAQQGDISEGAWRGAERGERVPRPQTLAAVCRVLGWPADAAQTILDGGEPPDARPRFVEVREDGHTRLIRVTRDLSEEKLQELADIAELYRRRAISER